MNISLHQIIQFLEDKDNCKVISVDNHLSIIDLEKTELVLHNKDYRLLNDLAKDYVKDKYPLFHKDLFNELDEVVVKVFKIPVDKTALNNVKPFKKIVKKSVISSVNGRGQAIVRRIVRKRKTYPNLSNT